MIRIDFNQAALLAAVLIISIALLSQWRAVRRMSRVMQRDLERIFEQVDLLRLDSQQDLAIESVPTPAQPARVPVADSALGYAAALELAAQGADEAEITTRCGLSAPEARRARAVTCTDARQRRAASVAAQLTQVTACGIASSRCGAMASLQLRQIP